jgi:S1-C subfamily serine protease
VRRVGLASARAPWKAGSRNTYTGTGFYIGDKKIITNHHVIKGQTSLRLKRNGQAGNFAGRLLCRSRLCDLALVTVDDDAFWEGLPEVELQDALPELDDTVVVVGYPASSGAGAKSVTVTRGVVSNLQLLDLSLESNNPHQLTIQIDAAINSGNSGGPVFNTDTCAVVGVAFASQREGRGGGGKIIPVAVLRNFLKVFDKTGAEEFGLLPEPGFGFDQLVNPTLRKSCFGGTLPKHRNGCLINKVSDKGCADGKLLVGDILMAIDGVAVSEDGDVVLRGQELLDFEYMFTKKTMGETVQVTVLREAGSPAEPGPQQSASGVAINFAQQSQPRQELTVELTLSPNRIGPPVGVDYTYLYATLGGLVFM